MELLPYAWRNVRRRPFRSVSTGLGVALAVASMTALVSVADGFSSSFVELFERRHVDIVVVRAGLSQRLTSNLNADLAGRLAAVPDVAAAFPTLLDITSFEEANVGGAPLNGWPADSPMFGGLALRDGRMLAAGDGRRALLGRLLAQRLGKRAGDSVDLEGVPFEVVGVYDSFVVFENGGAVVLLEELQRLLDRPGKATAFVVRARPGLDAAGVRAVCAAIKALTDDKGQALRLDALPTQDYVASANELQAARGFAWMVTALVLALGALGLLNTMSAAVLERTAELGTLKALGWGDGRVVRLVLAEAALLSGAGAVAGAAAAIVGVRIAARFPSVAGLFDGRVPPATALLGVALGVGAGVAGACFPAWRAARLTPIEALRHA